MAFKLLVSIRAQNEIEKIIEYYSLHSSYAPGFFIENLEKAYTTLSQNPFFEVRYKNVRALKIYTFPFSLYYIVDETEKSVKILSCFHNKLNPSKLPRKR